MTKMITGRRALSAVLALCASPAALAIVPVEVSMPMPPVSVIKSPEIDIYIPFLEQDWLLYGAASDSISTGNYGEARIFNFTTGVDQSIARSAPGVFLLNAGAGKAVLTMIDTVNLSTLYIYDPSAPASGLVEIDPGRTDWKWMPAIGASTIAYGVGPGFDSDLQSMVVYDRASGSTYQIPDSGKKPLFYPELSPSGNVLVWRWCASYPTSFRCTLEMAMRNSGWARETVANDVERGDVDDELLVYGTTFPAELKIHWRSLSGGTDNMLEMAGQQYHPAVAAGRYIGFVHRVSSDVQEVRLYDTATNRLYKINADPQVTKGEITILQLADGRIRMAWESGGYNQDSTKRAVVYTTFRLPSTSSPPQLNLPSTITVNATSPLGAAVTFFVSASDDTTPSPTVVCSPASGATFAIGATIVSCSATDNDSNSTNGSFSVVVRGGAAQLTDLINLVQSFNLRQGISNSLDVKLQAAAEALAAANQGDLATACNKLSDFMNEVRAQSGKAITTTQANQLLALAQQIRAVIGC